MSLIPHRYLSDHDRRVRRRKLWLWFAAFVAGLIVVMLLDRTLYFEFKTGPDIENHDWYRLLRIMGYWPTWLLISALLAAILGAARRGRAWLPAICAGLSGAAAELLKLVVGRQRPLFDGSYAFKPFLRGFIDGSNLGMPSSHAAVAFGGAFMLTRLIPGVGPVALGLAGGCGLTRLWMGAHFASDVYVAAALGYAWCGLLAPPREPKAAA